VTAILKAKHSDLNFLLPIPTFFDMIRSSVPFVRAYPLLRTRYTAALHTSAVWRMEKSAAVSNWNPFAKKQQEEQKPDQQLQNAVDKVDLNFNVEYQDKEDIPS
jgi:hypothetical protein